MNDKVKRKGISIKKVFFVVCLILFLIIIYSNLFSSFNSVDEWNFFFFTEVPIFSLMFFVFFSPLWIGAVAVKSADKKVKEESMSEIDFVNNKEYYRDILKKYSPVELSYIDDFNIDYPKDIIATLLSLKLKNKIIISNNFIEILDFSDVGLKESEKYLLKSIKDGIIILKKTYDIKPQLVEREALEDGLIIKISDDSFDNSVEKNFKNGFRVHIEIVALFVIFFIFGESFINLIINNYTISNEIYNWLMTILIPVLFFYFLCAPGFWATKNSSYSALKKNSYERTVKGEEVNKKIEGLKNYIKDFSILNEREQQELMIWEEYLIYSVLFNQNQKVVDDLSSLIEVEYEEGEVYFESVDKNSSNNN